MKSRTKALAGITMIARVVTFAYVAGIGLAFAAAMTLTSLSGAVHAAGGVVTDPKGTAPDRYV